MVFLFSIPFGCIYHARTFINRQNHPSISMVQNSIDPNKNLDTTHLHIPTKYQCVTGITILIRWARFCDTLIDVDC